MLREERYDPNVEGNAKCRHLKIDLYEGTLRQVFICLRPRTPQPPPPPLYTVYVFTVYLFTQGRGKGRVELERMFEGQQFTKLDQKYQHDRLYLQSIHSDKNLLRSPFTGQFL
jgi:hypothetical protein